MRRTRWETEFEWRSTGMHIPILVPSGKSKAPSKTRQPHTKDQRGLCMVCRTKAAFKCKRCNVCLCIAEDIMINCWEIFHTRKELPKLDDRELEEDN